MMNLILTFASFSIFMLSFIFILIDLFSSKRNENMKNILKLPKLSGYAFFFTFFALLLLVVVGFSYVHL
jgi:hypothetical protein